MHSRKINQKFQQYVDSLGHAAVFRNHPRHVAALFGGDQFQIDERRSRVRLPEMGWVDVPTIPNSKTIGWIALVTTDRGHEIAFGRKGVSPFSEEAAEFLPRIDGITLAMPFLHNDKLKEKMIAT